MLTVGKAMTAGLEGHMFCKLKKLRKPWVIPVRPVLTLPSSSVQAVQTTQRTGGLGTSCREGACLSCQLTKKTEAAVLAEKG